MCPFKHRIPRINTVIEFIEHYNKINIACKNLEDTVINYRHQISVLQKNLKSYRKLARNLRAELMQKHKARRPK